MRFYNVAAPFGEDRYAAAGYERRSFRGAAVDPAKSHLLDDHDARDGRRRHPLVIQWEPGSDEIAELVWVWDHLVMRSDALGELVRAFGGATHMPVEMVQDPEVHPPKRITARTARRIWLPYAGPDLSELWTTRWVDLDWDSSATVVNRTCSCGFVSWDPVGHERLDLFDSDDLEVRRVERDPQAGLKVRASDLAGDDIFRIEGFHGNWLMVTEPVKDFIQARGWRNVDFFEMGDVVPP